MRFGSNSRKISSFNAVKNGYISASHDIIEDADISINLVIFLGGLHSVMNLIVEQRGNVKINFSGASIHHAV